MTRITSILFLLMLTVFSYGKQVSIQEARQVAKNYLETKTNELIDLEALELVFASNAQGIGNQTLTDPNGKNYFYIFNVHSRYFVIVSADDVVRPILGYSTQGSFYTENLAPQTMKWLEGYKQQIHYAITHNIQPSTDITDAWYIYTRSSELGNLASKTTAVNPLIQTTWNQAPYYNDLCPGGSVTGCVATAMAQIMKYWEHPTNGTGFYSYNHPTYGTLSANFAATTYQWSSMPLNVTAPNAEVATIMYHCGVSVDMYYSPQVSGAFVISAQSPTTNCAEYAFKTYFGYKSSIQGLERENYTDPQWIDMLKNELDANRPILYAGFGNGGGHAFICDGYDNNDFFHFNWGWGGVNDGYFTIDALNPAPGIMEFNFGQQALLGIEPDQAVINPGIILASNLSINPASPLQYTQGFSVSASVMNNSSNAFQGDFGAAIFDINGIFVDFVAISSSVNIAANSITPLTFNTSGMANLLPGTYYVAIFYQTSNGNWQEVDDNGGMVNLETLNIILSNDLELFSPITVAGGNTITQGQGISVELNVTNTGSTTFTGYYDVSIYYPDGTFAATVATIYDGSGLTAGSAYTNDLTFASPAVTLSPGTYLLAATYQEDNSSNWHLLGSTNYSNPIFITIIGPGYAPDAYEVNNMVNDAYLLPVNFGTDTFTQVATTGSNFHDEVDVDYYKINLGSDPCIIKARLHDSYDSGDGNTYSIDAVFSYSTDGGITWSDAYDDVMSNDIYLPMGGTVIFHVVPYFSGYTGTYLLDLTLTKDHNMHIAHTLSSQALRIYPNPAKDVVTIDLIESSQSLQRASVMNHLGQIVYTVDFSGNQLQKTTLPLDHLPAGNYIIQVLTNKGLFTEKISFLR